MSLYFFGLFLDLYHYIIIHKRWHLTFEKKEKEEKSLKLFNGGLIQTITFSGGQRHSVVRRGTSISHQNECQYETGNALTLHYTMTLSVPVITVLVHLVGWYFIKSKKQWTSLPISRSLAFCAFSSGTSAACGWCSCPWSWSIISDAAHINSFINLCTQHIRMFSLKIC